MTAVGILIVDRNAVSSSALAERLLRHGYACEQAANLDQAMRCLDRADAQADHAIGIALIDQDGLGLDGVLDILRRLSEQHAGLVPIVISGFRKVESAVMAMRLGAADYLLKPVLESELIDAVERGVQRHLLYSNSTTDEAGEEHDEAATTHSPDTPSSNATEASGDWQPMPLAEAMKAPEKQILLAALEANAWNRGRTAQQLDINRTTLYKKIRQYRLDEPA